MMGQKVADAHDFGEARKGPPTFFPLTARKQRSNRSSSTKLSAKFPDELWCVPAHTDEKIVFTRGTKKHSQKFRNINTGFVFRKRQSKRDSKDRSQQPKHRFCEKRDPPLVDTLSQSDAGQQTVDSVIAAPPNDICGNLDSTCASAPAQIAPAHNCESSNPPNVLRADKLVDTENLKWCDGRFLKRYPDYAELDSMMATATPAYSREQDPSRMVNRPCGNIGDGECILSQLRCRKRKKSGASKGVSIAKRYKKAKLVDEKIETIVGDAKSLNFLDVISLKVIAQELNTYMGSTKDHCHIPITLQILKASQFDAVDVVKTGLDILLHNLAQAPWPDIIANPACCLIQWVQSGLPTGLPGSNESAFNPDAEFE